MKKGSPINLKKGLKGPGRGGKLSYGENRVNLMFIYCLDMCVYFMKLLCVQVFMVMCKNILVFFLIVLCRNFQREMLRTQSPWRRVNLTALPPRPMTAPQPPTLLRPLGIRWIIPWSLTTPSHTRENGRYALISYKNQN